MSNTSDQQFAAAQLRVGIAQEHVQHALSIGTADELVAARAELTSAREHLREVTDQLTSRAHADPDQPSTQDVRESDERVTGLTSVPTVERPESEDSIPGNVLWFPRFGRTLAAAASDRARDRARNRLRHDRTGIDVQWEDRAASGVRLVVTIPAAQPGDFVRVAVRWPDQRVEELVAPTARVAAVGAGVRVARVTIAGRSPWIEVGVLLPLLSYVDVLGLPEDTIRRSLRWATRSSRDVNEWRRVARSSPDPERTLVGEWLRRLGREL